MEFYGITGFLAAAAIGLLILREGYRICFQENKDLFLVLCVFLVQSIFYSQQSVTTPIYIILLAMALHGNRSAEEKISEKVHAGCKAAEAAE